MDLDAFVTVYRPDWTRLEQLARAGRKLSSAEIDELVELYGRASTHLSVVQAKDPDSTYATSLSLTVSRAREKITGARSNFSSEMVQFFTIRLPYAFYSIRWLTAILGILFIAAAFAYGTWVANDPVLMNSLLSEKEQKQLVDEDFVGYYSEYSNSSFAGLVWVNNAWIAAQEVGLGISGVWVPYILFVNAESVGVVAGVMASHGALDVFFQFILPHGLMEITAIFIAGAAGLRIFWAWVAPGRHTRMNSLAYHGRQLIIVAIGLILVLLISGIVEGFVTPSNLPPAVKIVIGAIVLASYWTYTLVLGGKAARAGYDADLTSHDGGQPTLSA